MHLGEFPTFEQALDQRLKQESWLKFSDGHGT
jgi:hypothetical protein